MANSVDLFQAAGIMPQQNQSNVQTNTSTDNNSVDLFQAAGVKPQTSLMQSAVNAVAPINVGAQQFGGNIMNAVGSWIGNGANPTVNPIEYHLGNYLQQKGSQLAQNAAQQNDLTNPSFSQSLLTGLAQGAPFLPLGPIAGGAAYGYTQNPQSPIMSAIKDAAIGGVFKGVTELPTLNNYLAGKPLQQASDNIYQTISNGQTPTDMTKNIGDAVAGLSQQIKGSANSAYNNFGDEVANRSYATTEAKPIAGLDQPNNLKYINPSDATSSALNKITTGSPNLNPVDDNLNDLIQRYQSAPTFQNTHNLQSGFAEAIRNQKSSLIPDRVSLNTANAYTTARNGLLNDIKTGFKNNGDDDLAKGYSALSQNYAKNVIAPYSSIRPVAAGIKSGDYPDFTKILQKDTPARNTLAQHIATNPQIGNQVIASALKGSATLDPAGSGQYITNPQKMATLWNNMPDNLKSVASPGLKNSLDNLSSQLGRLQTARKYAGHAVAGAGALGLSHLFGFHIL